MKCGLLGRNISYSYSKEIHEMLGLYSYDLLSVESDDIPAILESGGYDGFNVTIPYKKTIMESLDEVDPLAAAIGAVNTVYKKEGKWIGTNTDLHGFLAMAKGAGISLAGKHVLILGTGGASAMVQYACAEEGASKVTVCSRKPKTHRKPGEPAQVHDDDSITFCDYSSLPADAQILVNCTPVGTSPDITDSPVDLSRLSELEGVLDLVYNPRKTTLALQAESLGLKVSTGLPMLVAQATLAARYFLGDDAPDLPLTDGELLSAVQKAKRNIVLIGMPGCGKSSLGKQLAKELGRPFLDSDRLFSEKYGKKAGEYIEQEGEPAFREKETAIYRELAGKSGLVIATGGGVVERPENLVMLKQNGYVIYIQKDLENLATKGRPLSKGGDALADLFERRDPLYKKAADAIVSNDRNFRRTAAALKRLALRD